MNSRLPKFKFFDKLLSLIKILYPNRLLMLVLVIEIYTIKHGIFFLERIKQEINFLLNENKTTNNLL